MQNSAQDIKAAGDAIFAVVAWAAVFQIVSAVAAVFSIIWFAIRIWEKASGEEFSNTTLARWLTWRRK